MYAKSITIFQELGNKLPIAQLLLNLAHCERLSGDYSLAHAHLEASLAIFQRIGYRPGIDLINDELRKLAREQAEHT